MVALDGEPSIKYFIIDQNGHLQGVSNGYWELQEQNLISFYIITSIF